MFGNDRVPNVGIVEQKTVWTTGRHYFSKNKKDLTLTVMSSGMNYTGS